MPVNANSVEWECRRSSANLAQKRNDRLVNGIEKLSWNTCRASKLARDFAVKTLKKSENQNVSEKPSRHKSHITRHSLPTSYVCFIVVRVRVGVYLWPPFTLYADNKVIMAIAPNDGNNEEATTACACVCAPSRVPCYYFRSQTSRIENNMHAMHSLFYLMPARTTTITCTFFPFARRIRANGEQPRPRSL